MALSCLVFSVNLLYNNKAICMDKYSLSVQYKLHSDCFLLQRAMVSLSGHRARYLENSPRKQGASLFRPGGNSLRQLKGPGYAWSLAALLLSEPFSPQMALAGSLAVRHASEHPCILGYPKFLFLFQLLLHIFLKFLIAPLDILPLVSMAG